MKVTFEIVGDTQVKRDLAAISVASRNEIKRAIAACAMKLEGEAKRTIQQGARTGRTYTRRFWTDDKGRLRLGSERPAHTASAPGEPPKTDSGGLVRGISTQYEDGGMAATVGSRQQAGYGYLLELGTSKIAPRPWLEPTFRKLLTFFEQRLAQAADASLGRKG